MLTDDGGVDNDATLERCPRMAVTLAEAGTHVLGASGMMDGQVGAARAALDAAGHTDVAVLAYAAKYTSGFYDPFRDATDSSLTGDRKTCQMDPANSAEVTRRLKRYIAREVYYTLRADLKDLAQAP